MTSNRTNSKAKGRIFAFLRILFNMSPEEENMSSASQKSPDKEALLSEDSRSSSESDLSTHAAANALQSGETSCLTISIYSAVVIAMVCIFLVLGRDYIKYLLMSLEETNICVSIAIFAFLFTVVSFPMTWGYILLNIAAGYLYGLMLGLFIVMFCALFGISFAHLVIKYCLRDFVIKRLTNESVRAIMRVVDSDKGFKVVVLSRCTPIPFGLQNSLYAMSSITYPRYICASALGMLPSQGMHAYIGSTLRSMEEVIMTSSSTPTAYIVFGIQMSMILVLLFYIIRRARLEFNRTLQQCHDAAAAAAAAAAAEKPPAPDCDTSDLLVTVVDTVPTYYKTKSKPLSMHSSEGE